MSCDDFCNNCCDFNDGGEEGICDGCDAKAERSRTDCGKCRRSFCDEHGNNDTFECCGLILCGPDEDDGCLGDHEVIDLPCGHETCNYWQEENDEECRECASEKKATDTTIVNSNASSVSAPSCYLTCRLNDMSKRDLESLHKNIEEELKKRKSVDDLINELKEAYASLDWGGDDWKSEKTSDAVRKLESFGPKENEIRKMILNLDIHQKWKAAPLFTQVLVGMINTAEEYAGKLVNGSCGEWCPDMASFVEGLWEDIIGDGSCLPCDAAEVCNGLKGILGDYENKLGSVLEKARPSKRQKIGQDKLVVDLTSSP
jgi:hypothetical protein